MNAVHQHITSTMTQQYQYQHLSPLRDVSIVAPALKLFPPLLDTYTLPRLLTVRKYTVDPVKTPDKIC